MLQLVKTPKIQRHPQDCKNVVPFLKNVKFFKSKAIKKINLAKVAEFMDYQKVKAKNATFRYKDFGENYWLLLKG